MEQVYRKARQEGVTFIKHEHINCTFQDGTFFIQAFDGVFTSEFSTPALVTIGNELDNNQIIQKFNLAKTNGGYINGNKFFLHPIFTSRKGIFYFHPSLNELNNSAGIQKLISHIVAELDSLADESISYGEIDAEKCALCYSCYRVCPHAALIPDIENNTMHCIKSACFSCGACAAICPGQAIIIKDAGTQTFYAPPSLQSDRYKVFCCENSADSTLLSFEAKLDIEKISCGGHIGQDVIATAIASYDKVLFIVCPDDACKHMVGGKRACKHISKLMEAIEKIGLTSKKLGYIKVSYTMKNMLADEIKAFFS